MKKKVVISVIVILIAIQFIAIDKTLPEREPGSDFFEQHTASPEVLNAFKSACYDCHSAETVYPWYTRIQPLGWWIAGHIKGGRQKLNLSAWATYDEERKQHKIEEMAEEIENKSMPLTSYLIGHSDARISEEQRKIMADWLRSL